MLTLALRPSLLLTLLASTAFGQAVVLPKEDPPLPDVLLQWAEKQKSHPDMAVRFQQTRHLPALKKPVVSEGTFWRFQDGAFRWEMGQPAATVLVHDASTFRVREAPGASWKELDEDDPRYRMWARFLSGREASPKEISRHFLVKESVAEPGVSTLSLRPKLPFIRRYLKQLDLQISHDQQRLLQIQLLQGDGSKTVMDFQPPRDVPAAEKAQVLSR